ncbi:MAG: nuclear transport factor 2 family protein [Bacteroidota bacterium]
MKTFFTIALLAITTIVSAQKTMLTDAEKATIKEEVTAMGTAFVEATNSLNYEKAMSFFLNSDEFAIVLKNGTIIGYDAYMKNFKKNEMLTKQSTDVKTMDIKVHASNVANVYVTYENNYEYKNGKTYGPVKGTGIYTILKVADEWKIAYAYFDETVEK